jgi:RNA polymerase sigma-70 factor, ECF subfamily
MLAMAVSPVGGVQSPDHHDWAAVIALVARGDEAALAQFYDGTSRGVFGLIFRMVGEVSVAEDIALEVYMQVWRTAQTYTPSRGSVTAWLITLARSRAIDWIRSGQARSRQQTQDLKKIPELRDSAPSPELAWMESDRAEAVQRALAALPEEQRQAIELSYFEAMSHSEIAQRLAQPLGTVKSRIRAGMSRMRELLNARAAELL